MSFNPEPGEVLDFADMVYRVAEHPAAPGMAHALRGRAGHVYRLDSESGDQFALKVFDMHTRDPAHVVLASRLSSLANVPGLAACRQKVLSPRRHRSLLQSEPELLYAVIMPWIQGPTWAQLVIEQHELAPDESLDLARALTDVLQGLEERGLAHCYVSGSNVLLPGLTETFGAGSFVELVDVDQFYGRILDRPAELPAGSPGYAHRTAARGQWGPRADRFGGAILIAEMLGWCNPQICKTTTDESYFTPAELQDPNCERFALLMSVLRVQWGTALADLFDRAWRSPSLDECPSFGEWLLALPNDARTPVETGDEWLDPETIRSQADEMYHRSMDARRMRDWAGSLRYLQAVISLRPDYPLTDTDRDFLDEYEHPAGGPPTGFYNRVPPPPDPPRRPRHESLPERLLGALQPKFIVYATVVVLILVLAVALNAFLNPRSISPQRATPPVFATSVATPTVSGTPRDTFNVGPPADPKVP